MSGALESNTTAWIVLSDGVQSQKKSQGVALVPLLICSLLKEILQVILTKSYSGFSNFPNYSYFEHPIGDRNDEQLLSTHGASLGAWAEIFEQEAMYIQVFD